MQVHPIKPKLKPPGTKRLNCDILLSTSAFKLDLRRYIEENIASLSGAAVYWITKAPTMCACGGSVNCQSATDEYDPCTDISSNVLTTAAAYGAALSTNPTNLLATGADTLGSLSSGRAATSPVVLTLRDSYNQTVSSGSGASAALIASYPTGVTLSAGSRAVMANGRGLDSSTFRLNVSAFYGIGGALRGCSEGVMGREGVLKVYFQSETSQVELKSGRV